MIATAIAWIASLFRWASRTARFAVLIVFLFALTILALFASIVALIVQSLH